MLPRRVICGLAWSFLLLSCSLAAAQSAPSATRWPFRSPASGSSADTADTIFDQNIIPGVSQIIEGTLSPDTYIVGPGDEFLVTIWGKRNEHFRALVTPEGKLLIPQISEIPVAGLTITALRERLASEITRYFFDVRVEVTLIQLRRFQVYVLGDVDRPGPYAAHAVARVSQMITRAGGLLPGASARAIEIIRDGHVSETADLVRFTQEGALDRNPYVRDGDVVLVRRQTAMVTIEGAVWAPGRYELLQEDTVATLIRLARGTKPGAHLRDVELIRFNEDQLTTSRRMIDLSDSTGSGWRQPLRPDDRVFIRAIPEWHEKRSVIVRGEVRYPGRYVIDQDSTWLTDVITQAGDFTHESSLFESYVVRRDTTVTRDPEYERLKMVLVADMTPTEYEYFKMKAREQPGVMAVDFPRLFNDQDRSEDIVLKSGDEIVIAQNRETVTVTGQVASPGAVIYDPVLTVDDYIAKVGGFGWNARRGKMRVIKAKTGEWVWARDVKQLGPGDTIWVPEKPHRDWWSIFLQGVTTASQIATLIFIVDSISK